MSSVMQPVGPEDPQVYWKRRAIVGGGILLVLVLLVLLLRSCGAEPDTNPTADTSPSPITETTTRPSASPSGSRAADGECLDSDIEVEVVTNQTTYAAGESPKITMSIANTSDSPCKRDVGSAANEIMISSGGVQVYSTDDCSSSDETDEVTLEPGKSANVTVQWDRVSTAAGCDSAQTVDPGSYDAVGRNGDVESPETTFTLQ